MDDVNELYERLRREREALIATIRAHVVTLVSKGYIFYIGDIANAIAPKDRQVWSQVQRVLVDMESSGELSGKVLGADEHKQSQWQRKYYRAPDRHAFRIIGPLGSLPIEFRLKV